MSLANRTHLSIALFLLIFTILHTGCGNDLTLPSLEQKASPQFFVCEGESERACREQPNSDGIMMQERQCVGPNQWSDWKECTLHCGDGLQPIGDQCVDPSCWGDSNPPKECTVTDADNLPIGVGEQLPLCDRGKNTGYGPCTPLRCYEDKGYVLDEQTKQCVKKACDSAKQTQTLKVTNGICKKTSETCANGEWIGFDKATPYCTCDNSYRQSEDNQGNLIAACEKVNCSGNGTEIRTDIIDHGTCQISHSCNNGIWSTNDPCVLLYCEGDYHKNVINTGCDLNLCTNPNEQTVGSHPERECSDNNHGVGKQKWKCHRPTPTQWEKDGSCVIDHCDSDDWEFDNQTKSCKPKPKSCDPNSKPDPKCAIDSNSWGEAEVTCNTSGQWVKGSKCTAKGCFDPTKYTVDQDQNKCVLISCDPNSKPTPRLCTPPNDSNGVGREVLGCPNPPNWSVVSCQHTQVCKQDTYEYDASQGKCVEKSCPENQDFSCDIMLGSLNVGEGEYEHTCNKTNKQWVLGRCIVTSCNADFYQDSTHTACRPAFSCNEIQNYGKPDGEYNIVNGAISTPEFIKVKCAQGWTGIRTEQAFNDLGPNVPNWLSCVDSPDKYEWEAVNNKPHGRYKTRNGVKTKFSCSFVFPVPHSYTSFRLRHPNNSDTDLFTSRVWCTGKAEDGSPCASEIKPSGDNSFQQYDFGSNSKAYGNKHGDISFGSDTELVTSFSRVLPSQFRKGDGTNLEWPNSNQYNLTSGSKTKFRIDWGEQGEENEGWYPWYSGIIWFK